jgi:hypothetical protein
MYTKILKRFSGVSRKVWLLVFVVAVGAIAGVALLLTRNSDKAAADTALKPAAARIERVDGSVGVSHIGEADAEQTDWTDASVNMPVVIGDRVYARDGSHASIALTGHNYVGLNSGGSLDLLSLNDRNTQLALRSGSALFEVGALRPEELYEVGTPGGAVHFKQTGLYQLGIDESNNTIVSVLSGLAEVVGEGGVASVNTGEVVTLVAGAVSQALGSELAPSVAGEIVDDYYKSRYRGRYDGRYRDYDYYVENPSYYDSYGTSPSYRYVSADIAGLSDLDYYGDWSYLDSYGYCWSPRVSSGWAPFRDGYWDLYDTWGPTWVSVEPWGWAPYHYGRWTFANQRWFWVPAEVVNRPAYCPAPVAFLPVTQTERIAWVPLGPGEAYVSRYYDAEFHPYYLEQRSVIRAVTFQRSFANLVHPSALTVVPVEALARPIDQRVIVGVDPHSLAGNQQVLDPFTIDQVRQVARRQKEERRRFRLAQFERDASNVPVQISARPAVLRAPTGETAAFNVEQLSENRGKGKLRINRAPEIVSLRQKDRLPRVPAAAIQQQSIEQNAQRQARIAALAARVDQGDRSARGELRQLRREEKRAARNQVILNQQTGQTPRVQREPAQSVPVPANENKVERRRQAEVAAQQEAARRAQQQSQLEQTRRQRQEQKQLERRQQGNAQQQAEQMRRQQQQKQVQEQQIRIQREQRQQQKQQRRIERRKPPEAPSQQFPVQQAPVQQQPRVRQAPVVQRPQVPQPHVMPKVRQAPAPVVQRPQVPQPQVQAPKVRQAPVAVQPQAQPQKQRPQTPQPQGKHKRP